MATNELWPFNVPAYAMAEGASRDGCVQVVPVPLEQIDAGTLAELCAGFRAGVFARAAQPDPGLAALFPARAAADAIKTQALELLEPLTDAELEALRRLDAELGSLIADSPAGVVCAALALRLARELAAAVQTTAADRDDAGRVTGELLRWAWAQRDGGV